MDQVQEKEEQLREYSCVGDTDSLRKLVEIEGVNVNSKNSINGWTALHWACKRNHVSVVKYLVSHGADKTTKTSSNELPAQLTNSAEIKDILGFEGDSTTVAPLPITPNYIRDPVFPHGGAPQPSYPAAPLQNHVGNPPQPSYPTQYQGHQQSHTPSARLDPKELVLKVRVAYMDDRDFIEVELDRTSLTYDALATLLTQELGVERRLVHKIRKLPNTILRKDKDVKRLVDFQEIELVLTNKAMSASSRNYGTGERTDISDGHKNELILY